MTVVTLTGELGSIGAIGEQLAKELGYVLADRDLLLQSAQALGWSAEDVEAFDERTHGHGGRLARMLLDLTEHAPIQDLDVDALGSLVSSPYGVMADVPEMRPRDERYIETLTTLVRGLAEHGDAVIVGRGGQALLANRDDTVHVRLVCERNERIRRIAARDNVTAEAARARVEDSDREREAWHQKYFRIDFQSPYHYDLVINSGRLADQVAVAQVVQLVHALTPHAAN